MRRAGAYALFAIPWSGPEGKAGSGMVKKPSLFKLVLLSSLLIPFVMACVIGVTVVVLEVAEFRQQQARYRDQYDLISRDTLRIVVDDIAGQVSIRTAQADAEMRAELRGLDEGVCSLARSQYDSTRGRMTDPDIRKLLITTIGSLSRTDGARSLLVLDSDGSEILAVPSGAGSTDAVRAVRNAVHAPKWSGEGFVAAPVAGRHGLWYVKCFNPFGWVIANGDSPDRFTQSLQDQTLRMIEQLRFTPHGYVWILRVDGTLIMDPFLSGNVPVGWHVQDGQPSVQDPPGPFVIRSMIDMCRRNGAGFVQYLWSRPGERKAASKLAYVKLIPQWGWIVAAGAYSDDGEAVFQENKASLQKRITLQCASTAGVLLLILIASFFFIRVVYCRLSTAVRSFENFFRSAAVDRRPIEVDALAYAELCELAALANTMVSAQDAAEARVESSETQLRHVQKMESVGRLVSGIAHDFNNLLTAILGYSELILMGGELSDEGRLSMKEIQNAGRRAGSLTGQLLAFSRRQPPLRRVIDLNETIRDMERMLVRIIGETVDLTTRLDPALCPVLADPGQIEQVIINLVVNGRDAIAGAGHIGIETSVVELGAPSPGRYAAITITDTGCGMSDEVKRHLFEPYFTTKERGKGTGLGLSIVSSIVAQSDGFIAVDSAPGEGTTFRLSFPCIGGGKNSSRGARESAPEAGRGETVLLVEDDIGVRSLCEKLLIAGGYSVLKAETGREALEVVRREGAGRVRLLISDVILPDMTGDAVFSKLRGDGLAVAVLFISGYPSGDAVTPVLRGAGHDFLAKPFTATALLAKVRAAIDGGPVIPG
jgi:signal transduction histidine kinase/CheY-like chemotaxis protein